MFKIWLIVAGAAVVHCGTIQRRTIPVEVRYDREDHHVNTIPSDETVHPNPVRNLDEKVQLSRMELGEAIKHLPVQPELEIPKESTRNEMLGEGIKEEKPQIVEKEPESSLSLVKKAHNIVKDGIQSIRQSYMHLKNTEEHPTEEQWEDLEKSLNTYFEEEKVRASTDLKQQDQQNIFQSILTNVQNMTGNFIQNFQGGTMNNGGNGTQSDEQPNVVGQFINNFNSGVQNIQTSISNVFNPSGATTSSTNLGDSPVTPANIISGFVNNIQQLFNGNQGNSNTGSNNSGNNTQSDESGTTAAPSGPFQIINNVQGQIGNAINSFVQTINPNPRPSGGNQSDESSPSGPFQGIQQVGNQIGTAINNFINGGTRPPPSSSSGDDPSTQAPPQNFFQGIQQNVGNAFQNFISGGQNAIQQITGGASSGGSNPVVAGVQQIGQQVQTAVTGNPVQAIQGAIQGGGAKKPADVAPEPSTEKSLETEKKEEIMLTAE